MPGLDSYTKLLLHCDGLDGATDFPDASDSGHTVTANGDAQVDTAQYKFETASALFDGTGDYLSIPDHDDWDFGTGDFTLDCWVRFNSVAASGCPIDVGGSVDGVRFSWIVTVNVLRVFLINDYWDFSWTPLTNTWYHIAVVRNGNNLMAFINGTQIGSTEDVTGKNITGLTNGVRIGDNFQAVHPFNGWIDEVRISKGIARWTEAFTAPTAPYSLDATISDKFFSIL